MPSIDTVVFNVAVFISSLFLLEFGADKFIDHTAIVARRTSIPGSIIGLLTVGGEWEELAVVIASLVRQRSSLAVGNVVGSTISNILSAFSLGLLFHGQRQQIEFDKGSRIYSAILLALTVVICPILYFNTRVLWLVAGSALIAGFVIYIASIAWAIRRGTLTAPEGSDCDSSDDESDCSSSNDNEPQPNENSSLLPHTQRRKPKSLTYHIFYLIVGFVAISLSGYLLAHSATNITDEYHFSDATFGVIVLAIATTLPEKFIAVMSGQRRQMGIAVANTVGSNIFLLTLCQGIIMLATGGALNAENVTIAELSVLCASTLAFTLTIWFGASFARPIGAAMVVAYVAFIVLDIASHRHTNREAQGSARIVL